MFQQLLHPPLLSKYSIFHNNKCSSELTDDQEIMTGWEDAIAKVASDILKEQSPQQ